MRRALVVLSPLMLAATGLASYAFQDGTWRFTASTATVTFSNGTPTAHPSRLCILSPENAVVIGLTGGATKALLESETGTWSAKLESGNRTLNQGCYRHSVGDFVAGGEGSNSPESKITYEERYKASGISGNPGVARKSHTEVGSSTISKPTSALGALSGRLAVDIYGLDDRFYIRINDSPEFLVATYNQRAYYEFTQKLKNGSNSVRVRFSDKNKGRCFHLAYRIGDATSWKYGDNYANTDCPDPLPSSWKTTYTKTFTFDFTL